MSIEIGDNLAICIALVCGTALLITLALIA